MKASTHAASKNSQDTSEVAPYHSRTSHSATAPMTRQVGLRCFSLVLAKRWDRERRHDLVEHVRGLPSPPHAEAMREHGDGEQPDVLGQADVAALEHRPALGRQPPLDSGL